MFEVGELVRLKQPEEMRLADRESQQVLGNACGWVWVYEGPDPEAPDCGVFRSLSRGEVMDGWFPFRFEKLESDDAAA